MSLNLKDGILKAVKEAKDLDAARTQCQTPKFRKPTRPPKPNPKYTPPPSVAKPKQKENKTIYGLKLYIPFEDLDTYIHDNIEVAHKNHTFIPIKAEVNELDLGIEISLVSAVPNEIYDCRYKLDINKLSKENDKC